MCTSPLLPASGESQRPEQGWRVEHWRYTTVGQEEWVCSLYLAQDPTGKKILSRASKVKHLLYILSPPFSPPTSLHFLPSLNASEDNMKNS